MLGVPLPNTGFTPLQNIQQIQQKVIQKRIPNGLGRNIWLYKVSATWKYMPVDGKMYIV
jgi:hypothetical protein